MNRVHFRKPLVLLGMAALVAGLWAGLVRIGWRVPAPVPGFAMLHGALMVGGFLGTVIGLERAVALKSWWGYLAPLSAGVSAIALLAGAPDTVAPLLLLFSGLIMLSMFVVFIGRQSSLSMVVMVAGTLAWCQGNLLWLRGVPLYEVVYWWMAFLVLTIAGERILLSRVVVRSAVSTWTFIAGVSVVAAASLLTLWHVDTGARAMGVGLLVTGWWLLRFDIARRTVKQTGLPRFVAVCLLAGGAWLVVAGALFLSVGHPIAGPRYDAALHAVFLGFVFSMIFGHAPLVFPAVLSVAMPYRPAFYGHVVVLHASLVLRTAADVSGWIDGRRIGGLLGAAAIALFLTTTAWSVIAANEVPGRSDAR